VFVKWHFFGKNCKFFFLRTKIENLADQKWSAVQTLGKTAGDIDRDGELGRLSIFWYTFSTCQSYPCQAFFDVLRHSTFKKTCQDYCDFRDQLRFSRLTEACSDLWHSQLQTKKWTLPLDSVMFFSLLKE
jgi:hypothetical protein